MKYFKEVCDYWVDEKEKNEREAEIGDAITKIDQGLDQIYEGADILNYYDVDKNADDLYEGMKLIGHYLSRIMRGDEEEYEDNSRI